MKSLRHRICFPFVIWAAASPIAAWATDSFDEAVGPFFETHCIRCHGEDRQKGDFRIDTLSRDFAAGGDTELWVEVMDRINSGEMPPEDEDVLPSETDIAKVVGWLGERIREGEHARMAARPPVAHYRLSRDEYANTIQDLLGVSYDPRAPGQMTPDPIWHGFERIGSELSLSPAHVEKYLAAARTILDQAYPDSQPETRSFRKDALDIDWANRDRRELWEEQGIADQVRTLVWPGQTWSNLEPAHVNYDHAPGIYRARMQLSGVHPPGGRPPHVELYSKQLDRVLFEADVIASEDEPVILEFEVQLGGKFNIELTNAVPGPSNSPSSGRPSHGHPFTRLDDPNSRAPWQRKMTDDEGTPLFPLLIFDWIEWEGPITDSETVVRRNQYVPEDESDFLDNGATKLENFAKQAWRRPVSEDEMMPYGRLIDDELKAGSELRAAWKTAMLAILASKNFYYLAEGSANENRVLLTDWELASRLSYFLWNSMPDAELFALAEAGTLHESETLAQQVERMLADPRSERFLDSFPRQWLQLHRVGEFPPDEKLYPDYDSWLEQSIILETTEFFAEVFRENHSIREFLRSDWTMLNPRLALHYELPTPPEAGFQRVVLKPEDHRGGILTHASILGLTSDGTRHRPVHRGVWVSESIFGRVPNPPPANVDAIEPNPIDEPKATIRQKLEAHTNHASCASCHRTIDPLGLAFDNYDAIGRWRTEEFVANGQGANPPVDASGELPDGRSYAGPAEFKTLLTDDLDSFAHTVVEKLATYATRRAMTIDDEEEINAVVEASRNADFPLRTIIENLVVSELFRKR